jgi:hypothetical protein
MKRQSAQSPAIDRREAITVRLPAGLAARVRGVRSAAESLNDVLIEAVEREVRRRQARGAYDSITRLREEILRERGVSGDSSSTIRELREGSGRRG